MAERWQQWMPFHIDRFRGSPDVQAMHPVARIGYLYLLASAWQTDDCTISDDPLDLASASGLGDDLWAQYCPRILRKFEAAGTAGRLYNPVLLEEWSEAKRIFEARSAAARKTTETRSPSKKPTVTVDKVDGHRTVSARRPSRSADTITGTGTGTTTEPLKQKPSRPPKAERVVDPRHVEFREAFKAYFLYKNPGVEQEPWDAQEASHLSRFLAKNPNFTTEQWKRLLKNRAGSRVMHGENLSTWVGRALTWASAPIQSNGGFTDAKPTVADNIAAKQGAINARAARRVALEPDNGGRTLEAGGASAGPDGAGHPPGSLFRVS